MQTGPYEERIEIKIGKDLVAARQRARVLAADWGYETRDALLIATAVSELGRNILAYAGHGEILLQRGWDGGDTVMTVVAKDNGPGMPAFHWGGEDAGPGYGLGLTGTRRVMDEFRIESRPGRGTTVTVRKRRSALHQRKGRGGSRPAIATLVYA